MNIDGRRQFEFLKRIGFVRMSGTEKEKEAADMIAAEVRRIGLEPVMESFVVSRIVPVNASFRVTIPNEQDFQVRGYAYSDPICVEDQEYEFYYMEQPDMVSLKQAKNKFVLLNGRPKSKEEYEALYHAGIKGFLTMSGRVIDRKEDTDLEEGRLKPIYRSTGILPALHMRMSDALELLKMHPERVRITCCSKECKSISHNIVVTIPGTEYQDEYIAMGAHDNSVEFSSGVWDNGAGVVTVLEALRYFAKHQPKRTLKIIFFGSEEAGLLGSKAYLDQHKEEIDKFKFMFNLDVGGNIMGNNVALVSAEESLGVYIKYLACETGYCTAVQNGIMSSDSAVFNDHGIPSLAFGRKGPEGAGFMHTRYDMISLIGPEPLERLTKFLVIVSERFANAAVFPVSKEFPENLKDELKKYFLNDTKEGEIKQQ